MKDRIIEDIGRVRFMVECIASDVERMRSMGDRELAVRVENRLDDALDALDEALEELKGR